MLITEATTIAADLAQKSPEYFFLTTNKESLISLILIPLIIMQTKPQPEQITKTVVGMTTIFIGGVAILSSIFVVPAGEVGVVTTLGKVSDTLGNQA